jgi:integrase/recombinase XerD
MEITPAISLFLTHVKVEKGLSANTVAAYHRDLTKFNAFVQKRELTLENVTRDDLVDFLAGLYRDKLESRTVARHLVTLRNFFRFAQIHELVTADPALNLESPKIRRTLPGYLRLEEVDRLLAQPEEKTALGLRDRAMLEVLYSTGLRVSELIGLRVTDLDTKVGCIRCIGKGDKERIVPAGRKALGMVEKYLRDARPKLLGKAVASKALFVNRSGNSLSRVGVWKILSAYGRRAGLRVAITPHMLRSVQLMLGHADISTTQIYTHVVEERLKQIYKAHHPRA